MLDTVLTQMLAPYVPPQKTGWHAQLLPTLLFKNESTKQGEIWRFLIVQERMEKKSGHGLFDEFCVTDVDTTSYGTLPLNEVIFWHEEGLVELPAFQVVFKPAADRGAKGGFWSASFGDLLQHVIT